MKRCYSLKKNRDFQFTYRVGKSVGGKACTLIYVHDHRKPRAKKAQGPAVHVHVGFSVSKKIGNSVQRNRAKRRLREALSPWLPAVRPGYNLILIARPQALDEPFSSLCAQLAWQLRKAGLLEEAKPEPGTEKIP